MQSADAIIVGGGPAGSSCAWKLREAGLDVLVLDRAAFPRTKLCAGWVTPEALADLDIEPDDYPRGLVTFEALHLHYKRLSFRPPTRQYSVRRFEFDDFLLRRSGARVLQHKVGTVSKANGDYVIDDEYRCRYLVGAAGTACPVYRNLFQALNPRRSWLQTATYEQEFAYDWQDPHCHLWFFEAGLPGYAWYVPKAGGHVNVGLGAMAEQLKRTRCGLREHWRLFTSRLKACGLVDYDDYEPSGYSYYLRGKLDVVTTDNAYLVGDAVGLATVDMCEGIGPAIRSGLLAARAITEDTYYAVEGIGKYSGSGLGSRLLERQFVRPG